MNIRTRLAAVVASVVAATSIATGVANASPSSPTTGDIIRYEFSSNNRNVDSIYWYDGWNEDHRFPESYDRYAVFNTSYKNANGHTLWLAKRTVRSNSTYQITGGYISAHDDVSRAYVACRVYVNDVLIESDYATGKYATAYC
ncbi:hypothetical protein SEA_BANTAM_129 [Gordonia phage Bantam]|uniref:Uncharacterized protein n=1 Tax=Gordonia phage Bantam TaxID=1887641 RepID=A0A1B3AYH7_9CAUD|nr:hypothetical protein BIZ77_gp050 [Gordonia phage Bantam]AOE43818.1 hypothetical protein SEA_BANTAM_129 [Gordonia phage Bantam]